MVGFFFPPPGRVITPVTVVFNEVQVKTADNANNSFLSVPFGTEHPSRKIIVFAAKRNTGGLPATGVTIGGTATTLLSSSSGPDVSDDITCAWYGADVPTGTSGTVVTNYPFGSGFCAYMACYSIYGAGSVTAYRTAASGSDTDNSISNTGIVLPYGAGLISAYATVGTRSAVTFTGLATEDSDFQTDNDIRAACGNLVSLAADQTGYTVSAAYTTADNRAIHSLVYVPS